LLVVRDRRYAFAASLAAGALALSALPGMTLLLSDVIGNGQTRRVWAGIPWEYLPALVFAWVAVRERGGRLAAVAAVLAASSIAVQHWSILWGGGLTLVTCRRQLWPQASCSGVRPARSTASAGRRGAARPGAALSAALLAGGLIVAAVRSHRRWCTARPRRACTTG
jgi:hypothetical protein